MKMLMGALAYCHAAAVTVKIKCNLSTYLLLTASKLLRSFEWATKILSGQVSFLTYFPGGRV